MTPWSTLAPWPASYSYQASRGLTHHGRQERAFPALAEGTSQPPPECTTTQRCTLLLGAAPGGEPPFCSGFQALYHPRELPCHLVVCNSISCYLAPLLAVQEEEDAEQVAYVQALNGTQQAKCARLCRPFNLIEQVRAAGGVSIDRAVGPLSACVGLGSDTGRR